MLLLGAYCLQGALMGTKVRNTRKGIMCHEDFGTVLLRQAVDGAHARTVSCYTSHIMWGCPVAARPLKLLALPHAKIMAL